MRYDQRKIAARIKAEREAERFTKEELAKSLNVNRNTITAWERDDDKGRIPPLDDLLRMCDLFKCELGYLLGEYDCKTRVATDIQAKIGFSEKAIEKLIHNLEDEKNAHEILSHIIEHKDFFLVLAALTKFYYHYVRDDEVSAEEMLEFLKKTPPGIVVLNSTDAASFYIQQAKDILTVMAQDIAMQRRDDFGAH